MRLQTLLPRSSTPLTPRAQTLFAAHEREIFVRTDRLFAGLFVFQWLAALAAALWLSPRTWEGASSSVHPHVWAALLLGAGIIVAPTLLVLLRPSEALTRHAVAVAQMLMSALLIHVSGGRIETHFHVFGSLAFLAFYRDWRVLVTASAVVAADHLLRGIFLPQSVYGVLGGAEWRWVEHAGWVVFEDVFLIWSCRHSVAEMRAIAERQAALEQTNALVEAASDELKASERALLRAHDQLEARVRERTAELESVNSALEESEARLAATFEQAAVGMARAGLNGQWLQVNRRLCEITGYGREDLLRSTFTDIAHPLDREADVEHMRRLLAGEIPSFAMEKRYVRKDGTPVWVNLTGSLVRDAGGEPRYFVAVIEDIDDRKRAEADLVRQRQFLRTVIDAVPALVFTTDGDGRFTLANTATAALYGTTVDALLGKRDADFNPDPDQVARSRECDRAVMVTRQERRIAEEALTDAAGVVRWFETVKRPLLVVGEDTQVLGVATDVTEQKRLQAQLIQSEKLAAVGQLVAGVAHEINNPLAAIYSSAQFLEMHADAEVQEDGRTIRGMAERANQIVRSLLTFARGGDGSRRSACALDELICNTLQVCAFTLRTEEITLETRLDEEVPAVLVNGNQIQQVLLNLVTNAAHALRGNPPGARRITISTAGAEDGERRYGTITVSDNGCGMPEAVKRHVFEPFFTTKGPGEGTGLGLSVCHGIVQAHEGWLSVESQVGEGTTFTLRLPVAA